MHYQKGIHKMSDADAQVFKEKMKTDIENSKKAKGMLINTLLGAVQQENLEELTSSSPPSPTLTYREKVKKVVTQQGAHFTRCTIRTESGEVETEFLPDTGSISRQISGNYISYDLLNKLKNINIKTYFDNEECDIKLPTLLSKKTSVREHVYIHMQYKSRTESRTMRATLKAYVLPDLTVDFIVGKKDLLANCWIESKHLHGYDPTILNAVQEDGIIANYIMETYGTYALENTSPEEVLLLKRGNKEQQANTSMLFHVAEILDRQETEEQYKDFSLGTPEERMQDENAEYFGDFDEDEDYEEGELPIPSGSPSLRRKMEEMHKRFKHIFSKTLSKEPAHLPPFKFDIDEEKWFAEPEMRGVRQQSQPKQRAIKDYIQEGMDVLVEISEARKTSQVNMVAKPTPGEWRLTCDFRKLNDCCKKISFPLPKIDEILAKIAKSGSKFFAKIDLTQGFHQIPLHKDHRIFSAFKAFMGTYQYLRMPMGIKGAPQYFQLCMTKVLEGLEEQCQAYIDDIFVHGKTEEELIRNIEQVYKRLSKVNLTANPRKTLIGMEKLDYLGYTITPEGQLLVNEESRRKMYDYPKPIYKKQMKSFVGLVNVVQNRIPDCATIMKPLNTMIGAYDRSRAGEKLIWTEEAEQSFRNLKESISALPNLQMMKDGLRTILRTDASDYGVGGHLVQIKTELDENGIEFETEYTIMFVSKGFDKTQLNWCTAEKECYAVWYACTKLQYLLEGTEFEVQVDHKNLTILKESENAKVRRWKNFLQRFDITRWLYIPGPTNQIADALSRIVEIPEENAQHISDIEMINSIVAEIESTSTEPPVTASSRANLERGSHSEILLSPPHTSIMEGAAREDGIALLYMTAEEERRIDPEHKRLLIEIIQKIHNASEGHLGVAKTLHVLQEFIKANPEATNNKFIPYKTLCFMVKDYIKRCAICQKQADGLEKLYIEPYIGSTYSPMERVQLDHIGPLPEDAYGNKHILVLVDTFTRWVELYPVKDVTSLTTAHHLCDYIFRYGPPKELYSDNGAAFIEQTFNDIAELTGMKIHHPRAGDKERTAIVERENKEVRRHLNNIMNEKFMKDKWSFAIKIVQRILNNTVHTSTGYAPSKLMYGKVINSILEEWKDKPKRKEEEEYSVWVKEKIETQNKILTYMREKMTYKDQLNMKKREVEDKDILYENDKVLYRNMHKDKQQLQYIGPYLVTNRDNDFYELTSLTKDGKPFFAHARNLKRYYDQEGVDPVQIALMDNNEYLIESIVDYKCIKGDPGDKNGYAFAVLFKGYPETRHWLPYKEVEIEEEFVKWCYSGQRPYTLGWLTAKAKIIHEKLIGELNIVEAARAAEKRIEKQRLQLLAKTAAAVVPSAPVSTPRVQRKHKKRKT
jgi:hypothetical protein